MISHLFMHLVQLLGGYADERRMDQHDRDVARKFRRRQYAHADIPTIEAVELQHGQRFKELTDLLMELDPANLHTRKSVKGQDLEHFKLVQRRYRLTTWTLIYRLARNERPERIKPILETELSLWHAQVDEQDASDPQGLVSRLIAWRQRWDYR